MLVQESVSTFLSLLNFELLLCNTFKFPRVLLEQSIKLCVSKRCTHLFAYEYYVKRWLHISFAHYSVTCGGTVCLWAFKNWIQASGSDQRTKELRADEVLFFITLLARKGTIFWGFHLVFQAKGHLGQGNNRCVGLQTQWTHYELDVTKIPFISSFSQNLTLMKGKKDHRN